MEAPAARLLIRRQRSRGGARSGACDATAWPLRSQSALTANFDQARSPCYPQRESSPEREPTNGLALELHTQDGRQTTLQPSAVVDCVGLELDCTQSTQPLLRNLLRKRICTPHHTSDYQIADRLYTLWSLLTGQLWETIAVPELRDQAESIAERLTDPPARSRRSSNTVAVTALEPLATSQEVPGLSGCLELVDLSKQVKVVPAHLSLRLGLG